MRSFVVLIGATLAVVVLGIVFAPFFTKPHPPQEAERPAEGRPGTKTSTVGRRSLLDGPAFDRTKKAPEHPRKGRTASSTKAAEAEPPLPATDNPALAGLELEEADAGALERLRIPKGKSGLLVKSIDPASSAAEADLHPGDVITRAQRSDITTVDSLKRAVGVRDHTVLEFFREGRPFYVVLHKPFQEGKK